MKVKILDGDQFLVESGKAPAVGKSYVMEEAATATGEQNRAFHALLGEYWRSGLHSSDAPNFADFRKQVLVRRGAGHEKIVFTSIETGSDGKLKAVIHQVKTLDEVPREIFRDPDLKKMVLAAPKSWTEYTKTERTMTIDNLITDMIASGVNSDKFAQIIEGMGGLK